MDASQYKWLFEGTCDVTIKSVDPGVKDLVSSVTLFTDKDVRSTKFSVSSREYQDKIQTKARCREAAKISTRVLSKTIYDELKATASRKLIAEGYDAYVLTIQKHAKLLSTLLANHRLKKLAYRGYCLRKKAVADIANTLCKPRPSHKKTVLIFGSGCRGGNFSGIKGHARGPVNAIFAHIVRHRLAICIWQDEFRSSKLSISGTVAKHPVERQSHRLQPTTCRRKVHGKNVRGCRCFCSVTGCENRRRHGHKCTYHHTTDPLTVYGVLVDGDGRAHNRDCSGAINIACLFFSAVLGLPKHRWQWHTLIEDEEAKGWIEIFLDEGYEPPFKIYSKRNVTWPHAPPEQQATSTAVHAPAQPQKGQAPSQRLKPHISAHQQQQLQQHHRPAAACSGSRNRKARRSHRLRQKAVP